MPNNWHRQGRLRTKARGKRRRPERAPNRCGLQSILSRSECLRARAGVRFSAGPARCCKGAGREACPRAEFRLSAGPLAWAPAILARPNVGPARWREPPKGRPVTGACDIVLRLSVSPPARAGRSASEQVIIGFSRPISRSIFHGPAPAASSLDSTWPPAKIGCRMRSFSVAALYCGQLWQAREVPARGPLN